MTDPAEIDLEHLKAKLAIRVRLGKTDSESLIAAVEALQERVAELASALEQAALELDEASNLLRGSGLHAMAGIYARAALQARAAKEPAP